MSSFGKKMAVLSGQAAVLLIVGFSIQVPLAEAATFSVSGTLYSDQGTTTVGAGKTIKMAVGTSTPSVHTTTTSAGGAWTFTGIDDTEVSGTTQFIVWLDGEVKDATTISSGYTGTNISTVPLYYDATVIYASSTTDVVDIVETGLIQDSGDDADILFTQTAGPTLTTVNSAFIVKKGIGTFGGNGVLRGDFRNEGMFESAGLLTLNKPIDITSAYVSGVDTSGSAAGTGAIGGNAVIKVGNYAYMAKDGNATACSQTAGSALGCELMVFDVSDPVSPVYVAGRDASGDASGTASGTINSLAVSGNFLYVGLNASTTACSQTAGSAIGCEVQVYDISSSTNPIYRAGRDGSGSAAGTGGASVLSLSVYQGFLYAGKTGDATACSQTAGSAVGCEFISFDIASTTNPIYRAGRDTSGNATGTTTLSVFSVLADNNAVYITKAGNATACTQVAGTATGCELMVFTASGTNPIFAAGRDASASTNGTGNEAVSTLLIKDGYLYVGKIGSATACSNTAGSALGCEIQVYDMVSSSTNPVYIVGRDASGSAAGTGNASVFSLGAENEFVYVAKAGNATACSQTAGSAIGCELIVFTASGTNPVYRLGRDVGGEAAGTQNVTMESIFVTGGYVYQAKAGNATACSQTAGAGAAACELTLIESLLSSTLTMAGNMVDGSQLGQVLASGTVQFLGNASTTDFEINSVGRVYFPPVTTINGTFTNLGEGIFNTQSDRLFLEGEIASSLSGDFREESSLPYVTISGAGQKSLTSPATFSDLDIRPGALVEIDLVGNDISFERSFNNEGSLSALSGVIFGDFPGDILVGRDVSGNATGTQNLAVQDVLVSGNYMYVAKAANGTACTQVAGTAIGCELMVFDVSSSTNPIYVAGRDASGSAAGTQSLAIQDLAIRGNYLFIAKAGSATACSNTAGSAVGCELMVFDISSSTNPIYMVGRDVSGNAAGTQNLAALAVTVSSSSLFLMKTGSATACSQTAGSAVGCEFMIFDISSSTDPIYRAGRDADTSLAGTQNSSYNAGVVVGSHIYLTKAGSATACSQTVGSAIGCELQVYNISSSTNPVYVAGRDVSGNAAGTQNLAIQEIVSANNFIYISKAGSATACSQTAGSAVGCELMVFNIGSSTNPVYSAGLDVSGNSVGTGNLNMQELAIKDHFLYVSKIANATACSQVGGSAIGCELMVFDIASSSNPSYSYGRDVTGNATGTGSLAINTLSVAAQSIVMGIAGDGTACAATTGIGCELKVLQLPSQARVGGNLIGVNAFDSVVAYRSGAEFISATEVSAFTNSNSVSIAPSVLTVNGGYINNGTMLHGTGEVIITSGGDISGNVTASSSFYGLQINGNTTINSSVASTTNLTITSGGTLIAPSALTVKGNLSNQGTFDETGGVLYFENDAVGEILSYVAGRDSDGSASGVTSRSVQAFAQKDNFLYVAKAGSATTCGLGGGAAQHCELQVYDVSSTTNPVLVAVMDSDGSATGGGVVLQRFTSLTISGNYLYAGKEGNGAACSQAAGSATGCELQVYDISSSTNPIYVAGRDADASTTGTSGDLDVQSITGLVVKGTYLYVSKLYGLGASCGQTAGTASDCELQVYDISSSTNPIYVAGRDAGGNTTGSATVNFYDLTIVGNHLYIGTDAQYIGAACSQVAGSATGCELQVYDISSSTNPIYVAGRDAGGDDSGTDQGIFLTLATRGNFLYVGKSSDFVACSQVVGSATGCELQVYDISSSTNPIYVAGRDASGSPIGTSDTGGVRKVTITGDNLYVGLAGDDLIPCTQTVGLSTGCELQVYNISSGENPTYIAGRDVAGDETLTIRGLQVVGNTVYVGKAGFSTACSQVASSASGCELMVFNNAVPRGAISGVLVATSTLGDVVASGTITFLSAASTSDFMVQNGSVAVYGDMSVSGNFANNGAISYEGSPTVYFDGGASQAISGNLNASSSFANLFVLSIATTTFSAPFAVTEHFSIPTPNAKVVFTAGATSTVGSTTITGTVGNNVRISSTNNGQQAGFTVLGAYDVEYVTVKDSYASTSEGGIYAIGTDGGNNTNWFLSAFGINLTDAAPITPVTLSPGAAATTTSRFTLSTDIATSTDITAIGISLLTPNATSGIALIEITNAAGSVVYGSLSNPTSTPVSIVLDDNTLTVNNTPTDYLVRVTPKSHAAMPVPFGAEYTVSTRVNSVTSNGFLANSTTFGAVVTIDNLSPGSSISITEDFETGDLTGFSTSGDASWIAATDSVSSGVYSAKSGVITDNQVSNLSYVVTVASGTQMYFDRRVSSEQDYDYLQLYINEVLEQAWSGEFAWSTVGPYLLSGGEQAIRFSYVKDETASEGSDTAWIDNLEFSFDSGLVTPTATTTGADATISYKTPTDDDYNSTLVLYSTSALVDTPAEGSTYIANDTVGAATVGCVDAAGVSSASSTCVISGLAPGTTYYFSAYHKDDAGNYSPANDLAAFLMELADAIFALSGVLYGEDRVTPIASSQTLTVATPLDGVFSTSSVTTTGVFNFGFSAGITPGQPVTVYVDGNSALRAATILKVATSTTISNIPLYQNHVVVKSQQGTTTPFTNAGFSSYDSSDDTDVQFTYEGATNAVTTLYQQDLFVASSTNYVPQGDVSVGGSFTATTSATVNFATSTLTFTSTSTETITGVNRFGNLAFMGSGGDYSLASANASATSLTIGGGATLTAPTALTVNGNFNNQGVFNENSGTLFIENLTGEILRYLAGRNASGSASGAANTAIFSLAARGNYLYVGKDADSTACSQVAGSAIGCELMVFDISSSTNPTYVAGRDASGSEAGTGNVSLRSLAIMDNFLYVVKNGDSTACSQVAGSAIGCELMVFDISSSTNPTYVAGRDTSGSASGTSGAATLTLTVLGNNLYVGKGGNSTACSQVAGSAVGCELMVFDISTPTNPTYVAGRDSSGSASGTVSAPVYSLATFGNYLYIGKSNFSSTACSQVAGSAIGCELMVFDISTPTNPTYVAGRDASGSASGTDGGEITTLTAFGNNVYVGKAGNSTACSQVAGSAIGCELMVFDIASATNPIYVAGRDSSGNSAGTNDVTILSLAAFGNNLYVSKDASVTACSQVAGSAEGCALTVFDLSNAAGLLFGNLTGSSALGDVSASGTVIFLSNATTSDLTITSGTTTLSAALTVRGNFLSLANASFGSQVYFDSASAQSIDDSNANHLAFEDITFIGSGTKTLQATASTSQFTVATGSVVVTESLSIGGNLSNAGTLTPSGSLLLKGNYSNTGVFTNNNAMFDVQGIISESKASLDISGSATGTSTGEVNALTTSGNYLYIVRSDFSSTACSQTAGSAVGCELQVYDISTPTNPIYVAGRDISGSAAGTSDGDVNSVTVFGSYLYIGKSDFSSTACSQTAGSAAGCELMVFDISTPTNPTYVAGRDIFGSATGANDGSIRSLTALGGYLYVGKLSDVTACSQVAGSAAGCELMVFDISTPTNPTYVAGRDSSGNSAGTNDVNVFSLVTLGNNLYVGKDASATACSQVAGSAAGCELMVFDISTPINPIYVAGRDSSGNSVGTSDVAVNSLVTFGNSLYAGKQGDSTACSQTAGSAVGCELMVFDIASTTNPIYVAGRDSSGNSTGTTSTPFSSFTALGSSLFAGLEDFAYTIACSQTAGSAQGCELQVYDISTPTNPTYVAGRDTSGSASGVTNGAFTSIAIAQNHLYAGRGDFNSNPCSQIAGLADNCELLVFQVVPTLSGYLTGTSAFADLTISGSGAVFNDSAETNNFTIESGEVTAPVGTLTVNGNYNNQSIFDANGGTVDLAGSGNALGNLTTSGTFNNLQVSGNYAITAARASTTNFTITSTGNLTAPADLTIYGNYNNQGAFDENGGDLYMENLSGEVLKYLAGRDISGNSTSTGNNTIYSLVTRGNYLYVGQFANATACSQTAGSAIGCELQVYDISSSTNPVYVAGRDASGNSAGTGSEIIYSLTILGNYLYVGKGGNPTACSQTAGSAVGCEIMIFDISTPNNPTYVTGLDVDATKSGSGDGNVNTIVVKDSYLYVGTSYSGGAVACTQSTGGAQYCDLQVYNISSSTNPIYVAGRDADGTSSGSTFGEGGHNKFVIEGNYLYSAKYGYAGPCSQVAGTGVSGCELQVYNISSSTNPIYVAGREVSGAFSDGSGGQFYDLKVVGNYLYISSSGSPTTCSQTAGSAVGCELQVYDISSSTNPVYVAGRDASGNNTGVSNSAFYSLTALGNYLYVGTGGDIIACSQTAGSASGCELMVFDISSSTNPVYTIGRDNSGTSNGTGFARSNSLTIFGDSIYVGKEGNATACSQTAGSAIGCELMVFDNVVPAGTFVGNLVGGNALGNLYTSGPIQIKANASTSDFTILSGETSFSDLLTIAGNYENNGIANFSQTTDLYFVSNSTQTLGGSLSATSTLPRTTFGGTGVKTISNVASSSDFTILNGASVTTNNSLDVAGNFINKGSFTAGSLMSIFGNYTNNGTFTNSNGLVEVSEYFGSYLSGLDTAGNTVGTSSSGVVVQLVIGSYLYVGKESNTTACSQTAGSAVGCELQVYDISSSTNPVYVAGRDVSGSSAGVSGVSINNLIRRGDNYLYVVTGGDATACSQTAGSAVGCELQVYDISSSTNPVYVAGRDVSGNSSGTISDAVSSATVSGDHLFIVKSGSNTACSQTAGSAQGCELQVYDISSSTNPIYRAGRDSSGSSSGTGLDSTFSISAGANQIYLVKARNATPCSQTAGSAQGCELQVYDISSSTNPIYRAGRDSNGTANGSWQFSEPYTLLVRGSNLYVVWNDLFGTACSQTAGSAQGCELQVYDISSSTNPIYRAGRDVSGSATGAVPGLMDSLATGGSNLYIGTTGNTTACSQTAGLAEGCELQVYDISSSTNPIYRAGRDSSSGKNGKGGNFVRNITIGGSYLYAAKDGLATACSQTTGAAEGCELMIFSLNPILSGVMTATSSFNSLTIKGVGATFLNNASTTNFTIESGAVTAPSVLSIEDSFMNNATFNPNGGEVVLLGNEHTITGTTTFFDFTKVATAAATTTFEAGSLTSIDGNWNFTGVSAGTRHALRSSAEGDEWFVAASSTTLGNLDVQDSNNINVSAIVCDTGCLDSLNNTNWLFEAPQILTFTSLAPHQFYVGQATTTLPTFTITEGLTPTITAANDILIEIDGVTTDFRFDLDTTNFTYGGTAAAKIGDVFYEEILNGVRMRIDVLADFVSLDTLIINGVTVGSFATISTTTGNFMFHTDNDFDGVPQAIDPEPIRITGLLNLQNHTEGQVDNEFSFQNRDDVPVFAFNLTGTGETITVGDLSLTLSGIQGLDGSNISDFKLYRDINSDLALDGGDLLIDGNGILTINGQNGAVTWSQDFVSSTTANYLITADTNSIELGDSVVFSLPPLGLSALGATSVFTPVILTTVDRIQHMRNGGGGGGVGAAIGGAASGGDGNQGGGETGGGGGAGEEEDGENIAPDPDFTKPTATGEGFNEWTNGSNALLSDGTYATAASTNLRQSYNGFPFNIPGGNTITGIAVKLDASGTTADGTIDVSLSWDGGSSYTTAKATPTFTGTDVVYLVGGQTDLWGRGWTASQFDPSLFRFRVSAQPSSNTIRLDALEVRVYHQAGGGGSGGGGGI